MEMCDVSMGHVCLDELQTLSSRGMHFSRLPDVLVCHIFSCLSEAEKCRCARVSREWRRLAYEKASQWTVMHVSPNAGVTLETIQAALEQRYVNLQSLCIRQRPSYACLALLRMCAPFSHSLTHLDISGCDVHDLGLVFARAQVNRFPNLHTFICRLVSRISYRGFDALCRMCPSMTCLVISNNKEANHGQSQLTVLPPSLGDLQSLTELDLTGNSIDDLGDGITSLSSLRSLVLASNKLVFLPQSLFTLTGLQRLDVSYNRIYVLHPRIWDLPSLESLDVSGNFMTGLPTPTLGHARVLNRLNASANFISSLPTGFSCLTSLIDLNLSQNALRNIPEVLASLGTSLNTLNLSGNHINQVYGIVDCLTCLRDLDLSENDLERVVWEFLPWASLSRLTLPSSACSALRSSNTVPPGGALQILFR
mmetsp:Transcript_8287/g.13494  ORF Transcript_8287/g.13494 Transcript_8287/m.13494 type:complete len:423 (-) Transcript_8287:36-1304(-)